MILKTILIVLLDLLILAIIGVILVAGWRLYLETKRKFKKSLYQPYEKKERKITHDKGFDIDYKKKHIAPITEKPFKSSETLTDQIRNDELINTVVVEEQVQKEQNALKETAAESFQAKGQTEGLHINNAKIDLSHLGMLINGETGEIYGDIPSENNSEEEIYNTSITVTEEDDNDDYLDRDNSSGSSGSMTSGFGCGNIETFD